MRESTVITVDSRIAIRGFPGYASLPQCETIESCHAEPTAAVTEWRKVWLHPTARGWAHSEKTTGGTRL